MVLLEMRHTIRTPQVQAMLREMTPGVTDTGRARCQSRRRQWHPTPVLLPGKSHERRCLVGYSPWGRKESDLTERLYFHFSLSCTGEGNGNPLQCSCLENPRDGGAWWAAVYGAAQSRTRLKWLTSYRGWILCCCSCWPLTCPEGSSGWRMRHLLLQENWYNRSLDS